MTKLSVNLNKIALIRNSREGNYPSVVAHADTCIQAGADGITLHPRPDQRHIRPGDVRDIATLLSSHPTIEFNLEGNPFTEPLADYPGFIPLVMETKPHQCTLVPDSNDQLTSDHGFDLFQSVEKLEPVVRMLQDNGIRVSLFMDPDQEQIKLASQLGVERIELYTGPYAASWNNKIALKPLFEQYIAAAETARDSGLGLNAGHDLNLDNLAYFKQVPGLLEVSIGHALTVDAIQVGMTSAVKAYKAILSRV